MKTKWEKFIDRADDDFEAIGVLIETDHLYLATTRCYFCMFYCVESLLEYKQIPAKTHSGAIQQFSQHFIKTNIFETKYSEYLQKAFANRQDADYDIEFEVAKDEVILLRQRAEEFIAAVKTYFENETI